VKITYTVARIIFGAWFLFSGAEYFTPFNLQPLGTTPIAREFTLALIHSGLFAWIKLIELAVGAMVLANRGVFTAAVACVPLTVVIAYWNFVLDPGLVPDLFGIATIGLNAILIWPNRDRLWPLLVWKSAKP
jgi:uncharacterized membrane protein YphA (DoxX/SURF4 family)